MRRGTNLPRVGDYNQRVILDCIRRRPDGVSRVEIAELTGLSPQTASNVTRRLLDRDLIMEFGLHRGGPGKPRTLLAMNPAGTHAIGVHLDPLVVTAVLTDARGAVMQRVQRKVPRNHRPRTVINTMATCVEKLINGSAVHRARVAGVGLAAPGTVDMEAGVINPPLLSGWKDIGVRSALGEAVALPVLLDKDVAAVAGAEVWMQEHASHSTFVFCYLGTGVGIGLVNRGEVLRGASNNVGEIGHLIVDSRGPACDCGSRGCLGACCSPAHLVDKALDDGVLTEAVDLDDLHAVDRAFTELCARSDAGDRRARRILDTLADQVARGLAVLTDLVDADEVVFGGPAWERLQPRFLEVVPRRLANQATLRRVHPVRVRSTRFGADVGAIGAATLVLDDAFSTRPAQVLLSP